MSGKIEVLIRNGKSLDKRYKFYPYWSIKVTGEGNNSKTVTLTPTYKEVEEFLMKILAHERKVDLERKRRPDATKYAQMISRVFLEAKKNDMLSNEFIRKWGVSKK